MAGRSSQQDACFGTNVGTSKPIVKFQGPPVPTTRGPRSTVSLVLEVASFGYKDTVL